MKQAMRDQYEGNFLKAQDIPEGKYAAGVISHVAQPKTEKDKSGQLIRQGILTFEGREKRLVLNTTGVTVLRLLFGDDEDLWVGKKIALQRRHLLKCFGEYNVMCIRVMPPVGFPLPKTAADWMGRAVPYTLAELKKAGLRVPEKDVNDRAGATST